MEFPMPFNRPRLALTIYCLILLPLQAVFSADDARKHSNNTAVLNESEFRTHISYLASDELEGRGTGQEGIDKAADYITGNFKKWGVQPAGDDGTYYQSFTLKIKNAIGEGTRLAVGLKGKPTRRPAVLHDDYIPLPFSSSDSFKGEVAFAGYGIVNDELKYNDYDNLDVSDKVVMILRRSPKFAEFDMRDASFRAKASRAAARDAKAILVVNPDGDEEGDKLFSFDSGSTQRFGGGAYGIPMMQIRRSLADRMLKSGGLGSISSLQKKIEDSKKPASGFLDGVQVRGSVEIKPIETPVRNIIGMIPGSGPQRDEYIICGAHYDHLGIRNKGAADFNPAKDISNGADDNGSGTTGIMMLAKAYAKGPPPNRSMLFMLFTGEELGLLGSAHYAKEPTVDLKKAVAMLNFDMIGRLKDDKIEVGGMETGGFTGDVQRLAEPYHLVIKDGGGGRGPSDHTSFYNKNIPVLFFFTGLHKQYHQPEDDVPLLNMEGAVRVVQYGADIVDEIDSHSDRPLFKKDTRPAKIGNQDQDDNAVAAAGPGQRDRGGRPRGRLGIVPGQPDDKPGLPIAEVREDSPAEKAGVKADDRLLAINDQKITEMMDVMDAMRKSKPGVDAKLAIQRGDKKLTLSVRIGAPPGEGAVAKARPTSSKLRTTISALSESMKKIDPKAEFTVSIQDNNLSFSVTVQPGADSEGLLSNVIDKMEPLVSDQFLINVYWTLDKSSPSGSTKDAPSAPLRGPATPKRAEKASNPHGGGSSGEMGEAPMPPVRLGIMPTYGSSEGKGYEISGVVADGPAAKGGMKDSDRILRIGSQDVTDVYSYMEALRKYKPGAVIEVTVLRDGKEKTLKIKSAKQKSSDE
jgi:S1-C subfamily serine protease